MKDTTRDLLKRSAELLSDSGELLADAARLRREATAERLAEAVGRLLDSAAQSVGGVIGFQDGYRAWSDDDAEDNAWYSSVYMHYPPDGGPAVHRLCDGDCVDEGGGPPCGEQDAYYPQVDDLGLRAFFGQGSTAILPTAANADVLADPPDGVVSTHRLAESLLSPPPAGFSDCDGGDCPICRAWSDDDAGHDGTMSIASLPVEPPPSEFGTFYTFQAAYDPETGAWTVRGPVGERRD